MRLREQRDEARAAAREATRLLLAAPVMERLGGQAATVQAFLERYPWVHEAPQPSIDEEER